MILRNVLWQFYIVKFIVNSRKIRYSSYTINDDDGDNVVMMTMKATRTSMIMKGLHDFPLQKRCVRY